MLSWHNETENESTNPPYTPRIISRRTAFRGRIRACYWKMRKNKMENHEESTWNEQRATCWCRVCEGGWFKNKKIPSFLNFLNINAHGYGGNSVQRLLHTSTRLLDLHFDASFKKRDSSAFCREGGRYIFVKKKKKSGSDIVLKIITFDGKNVRSKWEVRNAV